MIYDMNKPSENMQLSFTDIAKMLREQKEEIYNNDNDKEYAESRAAQLERQEYINNMMEYNKSMLESDASRAEFIDNIKKSLISECIYKLYKESSVAPLTSRDKTVAKNLVNKFVIENSAGELIHSFASKNFILAEFSRICTKYYDKILEAKDCEACSTNDFSNAKQIVDPDTIDEFYRELEEVDVTDASKMIKDRVADAITDFVDSNAANKVEYEEIIKQAQDKAALVKGNDALAESYLDMAKLDIDERRAMQDKNIFGCIVESLTKSVLKDSKLGAIYIHEAAVDMNMIVESAQLIYTMLEMVNTMQMINIDENFLNNYLENL